MSRSWIFNWKNCTVALALICIAYLGMGATGCGSSGGSVAGVNSNQHETERSWHDHKQALANAERVTGFHDLTDSTEMVNQLERLKRYNNPNHKSYVYFLSWDGKIITYFPILGKCSSTDSQPSSPEYITDGNNWNGTGTGNVPMSAPSLDGSFGQNEQGIFCFLDNPEHTMVTWSGLYMQSDSYIPLKQAPVLSINESANTSLKKNH